MAPSMLPSITFATGQGQGKTFAYDAWLGIEGYMPHADIIGVISVLMRSTLLERFS